MPTRRWNRCRALSRARNRCCQSLQIDSNQYVPIYFDVDDDDDVDRRRHRKKTRRSRWRIALEIGLAGAIVLAVAILSAVL